MRISFSPVRPPRNLRTGHWRELAGRELNALLVTAGMAPARKWPHPTGTGPADHPCNETEPEMIFAGFLPSFEDGLSAGLHPHVSDMVPRISASSLSRRGRSASLPGRFVARASGLRIPAGSIRQG